MNGFLWTCLLEVPQSLPELNFPKLITLYNRQCTSYTIKCSNYEVFTDFVGPLNFHYEKHKSDL